MYLLLLAGYIELNPGPVYLKNVHPVPKEPVNLKDREGKGLNAVVLDDSSNVIVDGQTYNVTIRHVNCDILTDNVKCSLCTVYRSTLRALYSR